MRCVVFGIGSRYVHDVAETLSRLGWVVEAYVSNRSDSPLPEGLAPIFDVDSLPAELVSLPVVLPLGTPGNRLEALKEARAVGFTQFPAAVDPTAILAASVGVEHGVVINAGVVVAPRTRIARFAIVNRAASIGHSSVIDEYAFVGPGVVICGGVNVGRGAFVGAGAVVNPDVAVGANSVVGSGAVVTRDVPSRTMVVGNPARVVKEAIAGYRGKSV